LFRMQTGSLHSFRCGSQINGRIVNHVWQKIDEEMSAFRNVEACGVLDVPLPANTIQGEQ
jgi:hypothetical protein